MKIKTVRIDRDSDSGRVYSYRCPQSKRRPRVERLFDLRVIILIPSPGLGRFLEGIALEYTKVMA